MRQRGCVPEGMVRARMALVRLQTQVKNRIHALVWKQGLRQPALFSKKGTAWLMRRPLHRERHGALSVSIDAHPPCTRDRTA